MFREAMLNKPAEIEEQKPAPKESRSEKQAAGYPETIRGEAQLIADAVSRIAILYGELKKRVSDGNMSEDDAGAVLREAHTILAERAADFENLKRHMGELLLRQAEEEEKYRTAA